MSDAQRTIQLIFKGVDEVSAVSDAVIRSTRDFAGGVERATQPLADLAVGAVELEAGLLAAGAAFTTVAVIAAGRFDTAFREITTLIDAPAESIQRFGSQLRDYASTSTESLSSITAATYTAISAGVDYTDSIDALTTAEQLAVVGRADLNESMTVLVSSLNAYGVGMDEASRFADILFTTVRQGQTTLPELAASLSNVTGTAALLGVEFPELNAALAALTSVGIPTAQATTSLNAAMQSLIAPSSQASALARELGIEFNAQAVEANGLEGVLQAVYQATGGNAEQMATLFGSTEALRAILPLTGNAADEFAENLRAMAGSAGIVESRFELMVDSFDRVNQRVRNAFEGMLVSFGTPLLDEYGGVADAIARIFNAIGDSAESESGLGRLVDYIESRLGDLQAVFDEIAQNLPEALRQADFSGYVAGIDAIIGAFGELFDGIDLTTVDGLATAITRAGNAFNGLSGFVGGVITSFRPMFQYFVELSENLDTTNPAIFEAAGNLAGFATQANILAGGLNSLMPLVEGLLAVMTVRQGIGLIRALGNLGAEASGLTGRLVGQAGLLAAFGTLSYELTGRVGLPEAIDNAVSSMAGYQTTLGGFIYDLTHTAEVAEGAGGSLGRIPPEIRAIAAAADTVDLSTLLIPGQDLIRDASALGQITREYERLRDAAGEAYDPNVNLTEALLGQLAAYESILIPQEMLTRSTEDWSNTTVGIVPIIDEATGKVIGYEEGIIAAGSAQDRASRAIQNSLGSINLMSDYAAGAATSVRDLAAASNEFSDDVAIAFIEAGSEQRIAQIEATTERIRSAYESVNVTIESTGDLIGQALGLLADSDTNLRGRFDIERQLGIENDRRAEALELQTRLTEAQIRQYEAQTLALQRGDGIITIDGAGLEPELEAFMWRILQNIQVRANEDGLALLLGVGS
jgi:TP901 family phage tail tape measure protein